MDWKFLSWIILVILLIVSCISANGMEEDDDGFDHVVFILFYII